MTHAAVEGEHDDVSARDVSPWRVDADGCLPDLLAAQAQARPDNPAAVEGDESLSYRGLVGRSSRLAALLQENGVAADACVGLFAEPSIDLLVGVWGILFSGGAYLPLAPDYPEDRLRYMVEDAGVRVIVTQRALRAKLTGLVPPGTQIVTLDDDGDAADGTPVIVPGLRPNHLAYVIYTSGSTGRPKGVMIEHRSIVNQMRWLASSGALGQDVVILHKTPISFDAAQWEILAPANGGLVVFGAPGIHRDPEALIETVRRHQITALQCVPTLLQALLDTDGFDQCLSLTQVFSGGEALTRSLARQCADTLPAAALINLYGPTECTINASSFVVTKAAVEGGSGSVPIGRPVLNTQYHILDGSLSPVGAGETGELFIGGHQLARGYLHRPELTAERFIQSPFAGGGRLYRTGDLVQWNADGTVQFLGRADTQVKLRGFRVELDEIRVAIETHDWVRSAAVVARNDPHTGFQTLLAFVELSPREAVLMDQGSHGSHHQSKASRLQVRAQLANLGCRAAEADAGKPVLPLPGGEPSPEQRAQVFARKTYRFYDGGEIAMADILGLLADPARGAARRSLADLDLSEFGQLLRYLGQYSSAERLLPKYGYASPGALYATQVYLELHGLPGLPPGHYYYHPVHHHLILIHPLPAAAGAAAKIHFIGKRSAIEPVYRNNIREVLDIEAGHVLGLLDEVLPAYGLALDDGSHDPGVKALLDGGDEDFYLGTFDLQPAGTQPEGARSGGDAVDIYVQAHPGKIHDLPAGQYRYRDGGLERIADDLILRKHVIAINQQPYDRSGIGITVVSRRPGDWRSYIDLGRKMQRLQMNGLGFGFMSAGYSSRSGHDLPSARRIAAILDRAGHPTGPSYFFVGGRVSEEQRLSEGMQEDAVHMKGPAELIKDDLAGFLPDYMVPNRLVVLDRLPLSANGKVDLKALEAAQAHYAGPAARPRIAPRTTTEARISSLWETALKRDDASIQDDFFESGGNSLIAVSLINRINRDFGSALPLQILFEAPTIEALAQKVDGQSGSQATRLVRLQTQGAKPPVFCWPGLGGYPMNLRTLANRIGIDRPFFGVQAHGINPGETPYQTIGEMAAADIALIRGAQPAGPYTLWGYSFGAKIAFEAAHQLEQAGERVDNLFLIAPGGPKLRREDGFVPDGRAIFANKAYVTILYSVFAGEISGPGLEDCLSTARDLDSFVSFIASRYPDLDAGVVRRITAIVQETYQFRYTFRELEQRTIAAPVTVFRASSDDYSFIDGQGGYSARAPASITLEADHYGLLRDPGVEEVAQVIRALDGAAGQAGHPGRPAATAAG